ALMQAAVTLERELEPLQAIIAEGIAATERRTMIYGFITIVVVLLALLAVIFFFVRRGQLRRRREAYGALTDAWKAKTTNAAGRYVEFYGKRDGVLGLLELEGKTKALLDQVTREVDAIYASVAAMDAHLASTDDQA